MLFTFRFAFDEKKHSALFGWPMSQIQAVYKHTDAECAEPQQLQNGIDTTPACNTPCFERFWPTAQLVLVSSPTRLF